MAMQILRTIVAYVKGLWEIQMLMETCIFLELEALHTNEARTSVDLEQHGMGVTHSESSGNGSYCLNERRLHNNGTVHWRRKPSEAAFSQTQIKEARTKTIKIDIHQYARRRA
jgi:hypothetical protein